MIGILGVVVLVGIIFVALDWDSFYQVLIQADWRLILPALIFSLISYACVGISFAMVSRLVGIDMSWRDLSEIGFVTVVLNHILTTAGVAGLSIRYLLMEQHGVKVREMLSASLLHFYLTSLVIAGLLPVSFIYLITQVALPKGVAIMLAIFSVIIIIGSLLGAMLLFVNSIRTPVLKFVGKIVDKFTRWDMRKGFDQFNDTMEHGAVVSRKKPLSVPAIILVVSIEWAAAIVTMGFCFDALGSVPSVGVLITGFVIGLVAGVISMVPGGFGIQEASMAGMYAFLGINFQQALLVAVLFRGAYYLIPYLLSLIFYGRLMRLSRRLETTVIRD
jgi:uncharacterized protein (TIRG00374 family)